MSNKPNKRLTQEQKHQLLTASPAEWGRLFPQHSHHYLRKAKRQLKEEMERLPPIHQVQVQSREAALVKELDQYRQRYKACLRERQVFQEQLEAALAIEGKIRPREIKVTTKPGHHEATAILQASDWHAEEPINPAAVSGLNEYSLEIFEQRAGYFFENSSKLLHKEAKAVDIRNLVIHLGGDFISNSIHEDLAEANTLGPVSAILMVQDIIAGGLRKLLKELPVTLQVTVVCSVGNHERTTKERRISTRIDNSFAFLMYANLARFFHDEKRIKFILPAGYHTYVDVHGYLCRFHHGDAIRYGGGIGGITIPVNKAIANWNRARVAAYDFFGHFHQFIDGGSFVCNGSMIGYSPYAVEIKAAFEPPRQAFSLIDSKHGKTGVFPIILED